MRNVDLTAVCDIHNKIWYTVCEIHHNMWYTVCEIQYKMWYTVHQIHNMQYTVREIHYKIWYTVREIHHNMWYTICAINNNTQEVYVTYTTVCQIYQYVKFTTVCEIHHSMSNIPICEIHHSMWNTSQYVKYTNMWNSPQYVKYITVCEIHHSMWNSPQYVEYTTVCEIHHSNVEYITLCKTVRLTSNKTYHIHNPLLNFTQFCFLLSTGKFLISHPDRYSALITRTTYLQKGSDIVYASYFWNCSLKKRKKLWPSIYHYSKYKSILFCPTWKI